MGAIGDRCSGPGSGDRYGRVRRAIGTGPGMDVEYGFSCMGYEIAGAWGAAIARARSHPDGLVTTLLGDGSYLMLNSELFSAAFAGHPFVAVVCDNGGYGVIARLQEGQGAGAHNNLYDACRGPGAGAGLRVDFAAYAASLGATVHSADDLDTFARAYAAAKVAARATRRPAVVCVRTSPRSWTESGRVVGGRGTGAVVRLPREPGRQAPSTRAEALNKRRERTPRRSSQAEDTRPCR